MKLLNRFFITVERHPLKILLGGIFVYIAIFTILSFWKYDNFLYNALDLGIYSQVFESFRHGNHWYSSIQQSSYLGDHFEPFILALLPFYLLIPHPKTLLFLQTIFLALPAIPIFFIAKKVLRNQELWALGIAFFYLLNPLVHNINFFEFHLLPFSLVFIFCAAYFYIHPRLVSPLQRGRSREGQESFVLFLFFSFLALLTREDISLIVFMFGILALIERRRWHWIAGPMILGAWWFLMSLKIISAFNIEGGYKFLNYYSWIFHANPFEFIGRFYGIMDNWVMFFGLLFVFMFLPLFGSRFLVLAVPPFFQFALVAGGSGGVVWIAHYAAYFLPALFLSSIFGTKRLMDYASTDYSKHKFYNFIFKDRALLFVVFVVATVGMIFVFGPFGNFIPIIHADGSRSVDGQETKVQKALVNMISPSSSALLSTAYLSPLWTNQNNSALFWTFGGFKQFSSKPYIPPSSTGYVLVDSSDLLGFIFSLRERDKGDDRIRDFIKEEKFFILDYIDRFVIFSKKPSEESLYKVLDSLPKNLSIMNNSQTADKGGRIRLIAFTQPKMSNVSVGENKFLTAAFSSFWEKAKSTDKLYAIDISARGQNGKVSMDKIYPLGYGLYPASDWEIGKTIQTNQRVLMPDNLKGRYDIYLRLVDATEGGFVLDQMRSDAVFIPKKFAGEEIFLGSVEIP